MTSGGVSAPNGTVSSYNVRTDSLRLGLGLNMSKQPTASVVAENSVESNISIALEPKGTGAFYLGPKADGTTVGGDARGANAADLQTVRAAATQVASGNYSFAVGANNTASGKWSVAMGSFNTASGNRAVALGDGNNVSGATCAAIGGKNTAISGYAIGTNNTASYGHALGSYAYSTSPGQVAMSAGTHAALNKAQSSIWNLSDTTHNAVPDTLTAGIYENFWRNIEANRNHIIIDSGSVVGFVATIVGRSDVGDAAVFKVEGAVKAIGATASMVGTPTITTLGADAGAASWAVSAVASNIFSSRYLQFIVQGSANKLVRWHATVITTTTGF